MIERELRKERRLGMSGNRAYDIERHSKLAQLLKQEREALRVLNASARPASARNADDFPAP